MFKRQIPDLKTHLIMAKTKWLVDPAHSEVQFKAKHLMITTVTGHFKTFSLELETEEEDFTKASKILFTADIDSIETGNAQRNTHLKSGDFFSADEYKTLSFNGKTFENHGDHYDLTGDLTIRDITKPLTVKVEYVGLVVDPYGQKKAGFIVEGKIKRKEFNLKWDAVTEAGSIVVSDEIRIHCEIQLVKQADATEKKNEAKKVAEA